MCSAAQQKCEATGLFRCVIVQNAGRIYRVQPELNPNNQENAYD